MLRQPEARLGSGSRCRALGPGPLAPEPTPWPEAAALFGVVCLLLGLLSGPVVNQSRTPARRALCGSNLRQLGLAVAMYLQDYDETAPQAASWATGLYPYVQNRRVFVCPDDTAQSARVAALPDPPLSSRSFAGPCSFAFNSAMSGMILAAVVSPGVQPVLFDSNAGRWNAADRLTSFARRHDDSGHVLLLNREVLHTPSPPSPTAGLHPAFVYLDGVR